ncbi:unnamed protein product [Closterium sp. NIES-65]|nr:unnamed protein product [Closterium sp. NIES-65]
MFLNSSGPLPSYMSSPNTNAAAAGSSNGSGSVESPLPFCHAVWEAAAPGSLAARLLSSSTEELFDVPGDDGIGIPLEACGDATLRQSSYPHHPSPFGSDDLQSWQAVDADRAAPIMSGKLPRLASLQSQLFQVSAESQQMSGQPLQRLLSQSSIGSNCSGPFHHAALAVQVHSETFSVDGGASSAAPAGGPDGHATTPTGLAAYLLSAPLEALFDVPEEEDPAALSASGAGPDGEQQGASGLRLDLFAIQRGETPPLPPQHPSGMFSPDPATSAASNAAAEMYVNYPGPIFSAPLGAIPARPKGHRHGSANGMPRHIKRVLSCNDAPPDQGLQGAYGTATALPNAPESHHAGSPRRGAAAAVDTAGASASTVVRSRSTSSVGSGHVAPVACAGASSGWFRASSSPAGGTSYARQIAVAPSSQSSSRGKYGYASQQNQLSGQRQVPGGSCADSDPCSASSGAVCASFLRPGTGSASSSTGSDNSSGSDSGSNVSPWQMVGAATGTTSGSESYDEVSPHSASFVRHKTTGSVEFPRSRSGNYGGAPMLSPQHQQQLMHLQFGGASFGSSTGNGHFGAVCGGGAGGYSAGGSGAGGGLGAQGGSGTDRWVSPMGPVLTPIEQSPVTSDRYNPSVAAIAIANGSISSSSQRSTPVSSAVFARVSGGGTDAGCSSPAVAELTPQQRMLQQQLQQQMAMMMMMDGSAAAAAVSASALQPSQSKERSMVKASSCTQLHMPQQQRQPQLTFGGMPCHHVHTPSHRHQRHLSGNSPSESVTGAGGAGPAGPGSVISEADLRGLEEEMRQLEADMARLQANPARLAQMSAQDKQRVQAAAAEIGSMRACLARRSPSTATLMLDSSPGARPVVGGSYHGGAGAGLALGIGGGEKGGVFATGDVDDMMVGGALGAGPQRGLGILAGCSLLVICRYWYCTRTLAWR